MGFHRLGTDAQLLRHRLGGEAAHDEVEDFAFAQRKVRQGIVAISVAVANDPKCRARSAQGRGDEAASSRQARDGREQRVRRLILGDARIDSGQPRCLQEAALLAGGEHEQLAFLLHPPDLARRRGSIHAWKQQLRHHEVGPQTSDQFVCLAGAACLTHDLHFATRAQQRAETLPEQPLLIDQQHPHVCASQAGRTADCRGREGLSKAQFPSARAIDVRSCSMRKGLRRTALAPF